MTILPALLILAGFIALATLALLGFPTRSPTQAKAHGVNLIFEALQRRCTHDPRHVTADILEGCGGDTAVSACQRCGAVKIIIGVHSRKGADGSWRAPRASWTSEGLEVLRERKANWRRRNGFEVGA